VGTTKIKLFQELYRRSCELFRCGSVPLCGVFKVVFIKSVQTIYGSTMCYTRGIRYRRSLFYCRIRMEHGFPNSVKRINPTVASFFINDFSGIKVQVIDTL